MAFEHTKSTGSFSGAGTNDAFQHLKSTGGLRPLGGASPFGSGNSSYSVGGLMRNNNGGRNGANRNVPKTGGELPPVPPVPSAPPKSNPQWAFQPSPYDQPNYQMPMQNAAAYMTNPPAQPWMFDPSTYGAWGPPQWYGQPVVPNSQPPFRY